jgi:DNA-binding CsgD family transcriptional regulator
MRTGSRTGAKSPNKRRHIVTTLTAQGLNGDVIAARLGVNKNTLRAKHALELHAGRQIKRAKKQRAAATQLSKKERELLAIIKASFASHWFDAEFGNLLFGGARTVQEALRWCKGNRWNDHERAGS